MDVAVFGVDRDVGFRDYLEALPSSNSLTVVIGGSRFGLGLGRLHSLGDPGGRAYRHKCLLELRATLKKPASRSQGDQVTTPALENACMGLSARHYFFVTIAASYELLRMMMFSACSCPRVSPSDQDRSAALSRHPGCWRRSASP